MSSSPSHDSDVTFIRALAELLRENDLTELKVRREFGEDDSLDVTVSRQVMAAPAAPPVPAAYAPAAVHAPAPVSPAPQAGETGLDPANLPGAVTSPMVGTCYLQAEPGTDPFVTVGKVVEEGETVLIIEAMKTMNQIPAPHSGTVRRVMVEDGTPVEYGAPLMIIE